MMCKKFGLMLVMFAVMFLLSENASAITFSQPVKIGYAGIHDYQRVGGYYIEGATYNDGNVIHNGDKKTYGKGIARWGEGKDALYCEYEYKNQGGGLKFGGKNDYLLNESLKREISKIDTDEGMTLYLLYYKYKQFTNLDVLGCRKDGSWVKYIDMDSIVEKYFGKNPRNIDVVCGTEGWENKDINNYITCKNNMIVISYHVFANNPRRKIESGEFRFKWNDAAQWFGVEKVVY